MTKENNDDWSEEGIVEAIKAISVARIKLLGDQVDSKENKLRIAQVKDLQQKVEEYDELTDTEASEDKKSKLFDELYEEFEKMDDSWSVG